jgi:hypothetical protein
VGAATTPRPDVSSRNRTLMARAFTNRLRVGILVGLSPATYPGGISLPSAQAADADSHAGMNADSDRIRRARAECRAADRSRTQRKWVERIRTPATRRDVY